MAVTDGLKKKIGPLPMWAWIVIVGGTIGIILYRRNQAASSSTSSTTDPATGLTYAQEAAMQAAGIDPLTGQPYSSEVPGSAAGSGGTGDTGTGSVNPPWFDPFQQIDPATGQTYASEITADGVTDTGSSTSTLPGASKHRKKAKAKGKRHHSDGSGHGGHAGHQQTMRRIVKIKSTGHQGKTRAGTRPTVTVPVPRHVRGKKRDHRRQRPGTRISG